MRVPTDREILETIYKRHYSDFAAFDRQIPVRDTKIYMPVDLAWVAKELGVDGDIVFGRLYYYLDEKHRYKNDDGSWVHLFMLKLGEMRHPVHFPLLASILAGMQEDHRRARRSTVLSVISLVVACASFVLSLATNLWLRR